MSSSYSIANQAVINYADDISQQSGHAVTATGVSEADVLHRDTRRAYRVVQISDPDSELTSLFCELMEETFIPEECDTRETVRAQMVRGVINPAALSHTFYQGVLNDRGEMVAILNWDLFPIEQLPNGRQNGVISIGFIVTKESERKSRLTMPLYSCMLRLAAANAESRGIDVKYAMAETVFTAEGHFQTALGFRRLYVVTGGNERTGTYHEFEYLQPPLDFTDEGETAEGAGFVAEHLMLRGFGPALHKIPAMDVMLSVRGIFASYAGLGEPGNPSRKDEILEQGLVEIERSLKGQQDVYLITKAERLKMQAEGITFEEHIAASMK